MNTTPHTTPAVNEELTRDEQIDALVLRRVELDEYIARATEEKQTINLQLIDHLGDGTHETRHAKVVVSRRGVLDAKKLETEYPIEQYPQLYATTTRLSTETVKKEFAPSALEDFKTYSAPSVTIK